MTFIATRKQDQNEAMLDPWSVVHFSMGLAFGLMGWKLMPAMGLAVAYDVAEQVFERSEAGQKFFNTSGPESLGNIAADIGVFGVGWALGTRWNSSG